MVGIVSPVDRERAHLHPKAIGPFGDLLDDMLRAYKAGLTAASFELFEGVRHPDRQDYLFARKNTKARAWQSAHQYGLAIDIVPKINGQWTWADYDGREADVLYLERRVGQFGLVRPIRWDPYHVEHPLFNEFRKHVI